MFLLGRRKGSATTNLRPGSPSLHKKRNSSVSQTSALLTKLEEKALAHILLFLGPADFMKVRRVSAALAEVADNDEFQLWQRMERRLYPWEALEITWTEDAEAEALSVDTSLSTPRSRGGRSLTHNQWARKQFMKRIEHFWDPKMVKKKYKESRYYVSPRIPGLIILDKFRRDLGSDKPLFTTKVVFDGQLYKGRLACVEASGDIMRVLGWRETLPTDCKSTLAKLYTQEALFPFERFQHFITMVLVDEGSILVSLTIFFETEGRCDVTVAYSLETGVCRVQSVKSINTG